MLRMIFFGLILSMSVSCSSESERPISDVKIPLESVDLSNLEEELRAFGEENSLFILENDREQMRILNGGKPAISFWFSLAENKKPAINVTTVNEGDSMRVMIFSGGFNDVDHMESVQRNFFSKFGDNEDAH